MNLYFRLKYNCSMAYGLKFTNTEADFPSWKVTRKRKSNKKMRGNVCLLFCVLYGSVPRHKIFFCCFEIYKLFQNLLRKWQLKKFWKLSRIKQKQNENKKTEPLIEHWSWGSALTLPIPPLFRVVLHHTEASVFEINSIVAYSCQIIDSMRCEDLLIFKSFFKSSLLAFSFHLS